MNFTQLLSKLDAISTKTILSEAATKTDKPWTDKSGTEHTGTAVKGDRYTGKDHEDANTKGAKKKDGLPSSNRYTKYPVPDPIEEGSKPDFLDVDKDGDKEEPFKKAADDKKKNPFKKDVKETTSADLMKRWVGIFEAEEKCDDCNEVHEGECAEEVTEATEATTYTVTYKDSKKPGKTFSTKVKATSVAGAKSAFGEWDETNRFSYVSAKANVSEAATKTDKPWTDSSGKEHPGTAVKGDKYTGKDAEKEEKAKKKVDEAAKWRDPKYKDQLYTQEPLDHTFGPDMDAAHDNNYPDDYAGRKSPMDSGNGDPLKKGYRMSADNSINTRGPRKGLPSRDQITSLKGSIKDAHGTHAQPNLPEAAGSIDFDKVLDAIAALYGDDMWENDAMQDLANDLAQAGPTDPELDFIIAKGRLPKRLANTQFSAGDNVQFGEAAAPMTAKQKSFADTADQKKMNESLAECGDMMGGMAEEAESGMSINTNVDTRTGKKTVSVNADGAAADQLMQMLKMAGMGGHSEEAEAGPEMMQAQPSMADHIKVISVPLAHQDGGFDFGAAGQEEEVEEEYANEPNTQTQPVDTQLRQGNDLNREKTQHKHSYRQGDNPMAMREAAELAQLEKSLFEELATIKITKAK